MNQELAALTLAMHQSKVMSNSHDLFIAKQILEIHQPSHIVEIGAGSGGWCTTMQSIVSKKDISFTLVENMFYGKRNFIWNTESYPKSISELIKLVQAKTNNIAAFDFYESVNPADLHTYDTIRLDCDISYEELLSYIEHSKKNSIVFVDDFKINYAYNRVLMILKMYANQKLFPLWISDKESAWSTNEIYRDIMLEKIHNILLNIDELSAMIRDDGTSFKFVSSRLTKGIIF